MAEENYVKVLQLLSNGDFISGQKIASELHISRTAVWKIIQRLQQQFSVNIFAVSGKGYCVSGGLDLLNTERIRNLLAADIKLDFSYVLDSTNRYLIDKQFPDQAASKHSCLVEYQTAGKGRRGKHWVSGFARNIELSIACYLPMTMQQVSGISIACGVSLANFVKSLGVQAVSLKWPNDLHVAGQKIAGILVEVRGETEGPVKTVIGVGLNLDIGDVSMHEFDNPATDLKRHLLGKKVDRTEIAANLIQTLANTIDEYADKGLSAFVSAWSEFDQYLNQPVTLHAVNNEYTGIYRGINDQGMMLLENANGLCAYGAGEVSLRRGQ